MALKSTIFKADLQVADMDRNHYASYALTIARHPSETDERMMLRVLAFSLHADAALAFCKGLSDADEPDLWRKDLTGAIELWIEVGQPDDKRIGKACGRAQRVAVYAYGAAAGLWWKPLAAKLARYENLDVFQIPAACGPPLAALARRTMRLQCTIQDGHVWLGDDDSAVPVEPLRLFGGG